MIFVGLATHVPQLLAQCSSSPDDLSCNRPQTLNEPCRFAPWPLRARPRGKVASKPAAPASDGLMLLQVTPEVLRREIFDLLSSAGIFTNRVAIDFGAGVSRSDPWYDLATGVQLERLWAGINFDTAGRLKPLRELARMHNQTKMSFHPVKLLPSEAPSYLRRLKPAPPSDVDLLKIDIDSYDCELLRALLNDGLRPKLLHLELTPLWPRGVRVEYEYGGPGSFGDGCSCEAIVAIGEAHGYLTLSAHGIDVTMLRADLWGAHRLGAQINHRTTCSSSCGTAYCRRGASACHEWTQMYEAANHSGLLLEAAHVIAQNPAATASVTSDHTLHRVNVRRGHVHVATTH